MEIVYIVGICLSLFGWVWLLGAALSEGLGWFLLCLLCGPGQLVFVFLKLDRAGMPFVLQLLGTGICYVGALSAEPGARF